MGHHRYKDCCDQPCHPSKCTSSSQVESRS
jgi:hypothetical protein